MEASESLLAKLPAPLRLDSIRSKILVLALLATLVPALSTATLSYVRTRSALTETLQGELRGIGAQTAREMDLWVKERFYDLRVFVGSFEVTENLERVRRGSPRPAEARTRLTEYLTVVQQRFREYSGLVVFDDRGTVAASAEGAVGASELPAGWLDELALGDTRLGEPYWNDELGTVAATTGVPIQSADGRFIGVLLATLTFEPEQATLAALAPGDDGGGIYVLAEDGRAIVAHEPLAGFSRPVSEEALAQLSSAEATAQYTSESGVDMVGTVTAVPGIDWTVLVQLPSGEAFAPITRLTISTLMLVTILMLVVGTAAYFIGLLITRPLARLAEAAGAVAEGDLTVDLPVTGRDEVSYLTGVFNGMVSRLRENADALRTQNEELERLSMTDALTSLHNRRYVMDVFEKEILRAARHKRDVSVLMLDVDKFKQYNDTWGHQAGDEVLAGMGTVLIDATRESDVPARYGGEEFIVVLPDTDLEGAVGAAERIRTRLDKEVFEGRKVTVSIGAAAFPLHGDSPTDLIAAADVALYAAKEGGRDRVVAAEAPTEKAEEKDTKKKTAAKKASTKTATAKKASTKKASTKKAPSKKKAPKEEE